MQVKKILGLFVDDLKMISPNYKDKEDEFKIDTLLRELDSIRYTENKFAHILRSYLQMLYDEAQEEENSRYTGNYQSDLDYICQFIASHLKCVPSTKKLMDICYEIEQMHCKDFKKHCICPMHTLIDGGAGTPITLISKNEVKALISDIRKNKLTKPLLNKFKINYLTKWHSGYHNYLSAIIDRVTS